MQNDPRYAAVNDGLVYPAITREEATEAARRLIREFGKLADASANRTAPMSIDPSKPGKLRFWTDGHGYRRVWISRVPMAGHHKGWGRLIHDLAHMVFSYRHPGWRPHEHGHERLELEIKQFVHESGWLNGSLRPTASPKPKASDKLAALIERKARWESKAKRAANAIRKLNRRIAYYQRKDARPCAMTAQAPGIGA